MSSLENFNCRYTSGGDAVPLNLYPPGFDTNTLNIFEASQILWLSSDQAVETLLSAMRNGPSDNDPDPPGPNPDPSNSTGFYRVVRNGPHLVGITNGIVLTGVVAIQAEVGNYAGDLVSLSVAEEGSPVGNSLHSAPFESPTPVLRLDTTKMTNGVHQIMASARWESAGDEQTESGATSYEADSPVVEVNIQNEISFPAWMPNFGELNDLLLIKVMSAHADADWFIDVYDSQYQYIGTFGDHTTDGNIEAVWDLIGPQGEPHTNDSFFIFVATTVYGSPPATASAVTPQTFRLRDPWAGKGAFVIAAHHAFDNVSDHETLYEEVDGFVGLAQAGSFDVLPAPTDGHAFGIHFGSAQATTDWGTLRTALYNPLSRNLIYFGHGAPSGLGTDPAKTNRFISDVELGSVLGTMPATTNRHNFRFVIVDGCDTAKGKLPEAFGMLHREKVPFQDYDNAGMRPSAFGGWSADKWVGVLNGSVLNYQHVYFIQHIVQFLGFGDGIKDAVKHAGGQPDVSLINSDEFKVYGYWDLTFGAYNQ